jgi:hypothetical protein
LERGARYDPAMGNPWWWVGLIVLVILIVVFIVPHV